MGRVIHKQLDGLFAVWSTVVDDYVAIDCDLEDAVDVIVEPFVENMRVQCKRYIREADDDLIVKCRKEWLEVENAKKDSENTG